ncbi:hypothetical protein THAOC_30016, partial [Thalassiosira oceanica]
PSLPDVPESVARQLHPAAARLRPDAGGGGGGHGGHRVSADQARAGPSVSFSPELYYSYRAQMVPRQPTGPSRTPWAMFFGRGPAGPIPIQRIQRPGGGRLLPRMNGWFGPRYSAVWKGVPMVGLHPILRVGSTLCPCNDLQSMTLIRPCAQPRDSKTRAAKNAAAQED